MGKGPNEKLVKFSDDEVGRLFQLYSDAEVEILEEINRGLLKGNNINYLQGMLQNVQAILSDLLAGSRTWCEQAIPRVYLEGAKAADEQMKAMGTEVKVGFAAIHQQAAQVLAESAYDRFDDMVSFIGRRVDDIYRTLALENVKGSVIGYKTWQQVAKNYREQLAEQGITAFKDIKGRKWNMRTYTEMVARTSTMEAHLQGTAIRLQEHGHDLVKVSTHVGACEKCAPWQGKVLSLSGKTEGHPTLQEAKNAGLMHPNCFPAGVLVNGPPPLAVSTRWYDGELVILHTASGIELPVTPNHPILTPKGWVAAGQLVKGGNVLCQLGEEGMMQSINPYKDQIPSRIEDVACSFGEPERVLTISMPVAPEDFHGDGTGSDICIIRTNGLLRGNDNSFSCEPFSQKAFGSTTEPPEGLETLGVVNLLFKRLFAATNSVMGSLSQCLPFARSHTGKACSHCGRPIRGSINAKIFQAFLNRGLVYAQAFSNSLFGFACQVALENNIAVQRYPAIDSGLLEVANDNPVVFQSGFNGLLADVQGGRKLIERFAGSVATDEITDIERRAFSGHVYGLQTTDGWYACNNIITHNCKHAYGLYIDLGNDNKPTKQHEAEPAPAKQTIKPEPKPDPKPIKPKESPVFKTAKEAERWAQSNLGIAHVDYTNIHVTAANEINKTVYAFKQKFPQVQDTKWLSTGEQMFEAKYETEMANAVQRLKQIGHSEDEAVRLDSINIKKNKVPENAYAFSTDRAWGEYEGIAISEKYVKTARGFEEMRTKMAGDIAVGFHPIGTEDPSSVITHEMGHQLHYLLMNSNKADFIKGVWKDFHKEALKKVREGSQMAYGELLSKYAATNEKEFFAEAISEYIHSPSPRKYAKIIGEEAEKALTEL